MANFLLTSSGPKEEPKKRATKKKVGKRTDKVAAAKAKSKALKAKKEPKAKPVKIEVKKEEPSGLLANNPPTWAYKKGEEGVILYTREDIVKYAENGWTDNPFFEDNK